MTGESLVNSLKYVACVLTSSESLVTTIYKNKERVFMMTKNIIHTIFVGK